MSNIFKYKTSNGNALTTNKWINNSKSGDQYQEDGWWCFEYSFQGISDAAFYNVNFTEVDTGDGIDWLGEESSIFVGCNDLKKVYLGKNVHIDYNAVFSSCPNVEVVVVDVENENIDSRDNCNAIIETEYNRFVTGCKSSFVPKTVETIASDAFYGIDLTTLTCLPTTPPELEGNPFSYSWSPDVKTLYVPKESVSAYQVSDWANYFSYILPIPDPKPACGFNLSGMIDIDYLDEIGIRYNR